MSNEIIVFQSSNETENIVKEHREIEYEKLEVDIGQENTFHVNNLLDMNENISSSKSYWIESNILSILTKQTLTYFKPIVGGISHEDNKNFYIQLQLNYEIECIVVNDDKDSHIKSLTIPSEIPFRVIGIQTDKLLLPHLDYNSVNNSHPILTNINDIYRSGSYSYEMNLKNANNIAPFTQQLIHIDKNFDEAPLFNKETILFKDASDAKQSMEKILRKIQLARSYYTQYLPFFMYVKPLSVIKCDAYKNIKQAENKIQAELNDLLYYPYINENGLKEKLMGEDLFILYNKIKKLGVNDEEVQTAITLKKVSNKIKRDRVSQSKEIALQYAEDFRKQAIVNRKFPDKQFKDLSAKEKEVVNREFELLNRKNKFIKDKEIRKTTTAFLKAFDTINTADALQIAYDNVNLLLKDKSLELKDIGLCTHYTKHADILLAAYKDRSIYKSKSAFDIRELLIKTFTTPDTIIDDEYYCKLCGQLIASDDNSEVADFVGDVKMSSGNEFDALEELVYRDISHIIRTYIKFKNLVDVRPIIKSMSATLTPEMHIIETKLKQIQTNISDDIRDLMGMYIYIYVFALVSHMIYVNYGQITFAFREGAFGGGRSHGLPRNGYLPKDGGDDSSGDSSKERLQNILKNALYLINSTKIRLLKASTNIGVDKVKPILLQAYQWVLKLQTIKTVAASDTDINYEILNSITSSSIYNYFQTARTIIDPKIKLTDLTSVIGTSVNAIKEANYKTKKEKINPFKTTPVITEKEWKKTGNQYYDEYTYGSYLQSVNYEKEERYNAFVTPLSEALLTHYKNAERLLKLERRIRFQSRFAENNRTFNVIKRTFEYKNAAKILYNVGLYYRPDGNKRSWSTFVLEDDSGKPLELKFDELMKLDFKKRRSLIIKDRKDGDEYKSNVKDYSDIINKQFEKTDYSKLLLEYFENRCPTGGIHEFGLTDVCTKCARDMDPKWIHTDDANKYVKTNSETFNKHNNLKFNLVKIGLEKIKKLTHVRDFKFNKYENWNYSEVPILEWSRINPKVNMNMLLNLGCSEHRKYVLIEKERDNPIKNYDNTGHFGRISKLDSYYNAMIRDYYAVKNYQLYTVNPVLYKELIDKYKTELTKLPDLIDNDYDKKIEWYKISHHDEMSLVCNFILTQISNNIIMVSKLGNHGKALAELLTSAIIHKERMFSKPEPFKITIDKRTKDDEYQSDTSSEGSNVDDEISVESSDFSEAESDTNEQNQETEAYSFGLGDNAIDDVNNGNDDDEGSGTASD